MSLQRRTFGTVGARSRPDGPPQEVGQVIDLEEEVLRRPIVRSATRPWKPRPGRVYNFSIQRAVEEK